MIDQVFIHIISGKGGNGNISGRREKFVPRGGPDGGDGGRGGDVYFISDENVNTLLAFRYTRRFVAGNGGNGEGGKRHGKDGDDVNIVVPVGTQVWLEESPSRLLVDLNKPGQRVLIAHGGSGGRGNTRFATSTNRFPLLAEAGESGEEMRLRLELKLLADVGIIGKPNAGKSSLLSVVSAARPKIADYPFTTLEPALGVVDHHNETFVMVDIPGLIEGASEGIGLGHEFLRHIERTRVLVHLVDGSSNDPIGDYRQINEELGQFNEELLAKPQIIAVNKLDIPDVRELMDVFREELAGEGAPLYFISAVTREGVDALLDRVLREIQEVRQVQEIKQRETNIEDLPVLRPKPRREGVTVRKRRNGDFVVAAPVAERIAPMIDSSDWNARIQFYGYLQRVGVIKVLEEAGVLPGDTVHIGEIEWEWE